MEEKRIEFLHHSLCIYVNILSSASSQDQEVSPPKTSRNVQYEVMLYNKNINIYTARFFFIFSLMNDFGKHWINVMLTQI